MGKRATMTANAQARAALDRLAVEAGYENAAAFREAMEAFEAWRKGLIVESDSVRRGEIETAAERQRREREAGGHVKPAQRGTDDAPQAATLAAAGRSLAVVNPERGFSESAGAAALRDLSACAVVKLHAEGRIGDDGVKAAFRFGELAVRALGQPGPAGCAFVRTGASAAGEEVSARYADDFRTYRRIAAALTGDQFGMLDRVMRFGDSLTRAAGDVFGERWSSRNARAAAGAVALESGCAWLSDFWGYR
ncbi:hypothetical protein [Euryhalocaulis caribicus]|uniref:hypothetical protein n=1 Tax=Euryhalocaulis caribicus TaxID=1161401 RepID=UPI0003A36D88|nr:hypothetical protein [Euryhalocaulis caribicus]